jgi:hypothetical protein
MKLYKKIILFVASFLFYAIHVKSSEEIMINLTFDFIWGLAGGSIRAIPYGKSHEAIHPRLPFLSEHNIREGILTMIKYAFWRNKKNYNENDENLPAQDNPKKWSFYTQERSHEIFFGTPCGTVVPPQGEDNNLLNYYGALFREGIITVVNNMASDRGEIITKRLIDAVEKKINMRIEDDLKYLLMSLGGSIGSLAWSYAIGQWRSLKKEDSSDTSKLVWCWPSSVIPKTLSFGLQFEMDGFDFPMIKIIFYG